MSPFPNIISASRGVSALAMLCFPAFSSGFWWLYCWGGVSDMIDGALARKLNSVSEAGSRLDSSADLIFVVCSAIMILPSVNLPVWVWLWITAIGLAKSAGIFIGSFRLCKLTIPHSISNRLTGILLFCLPFAFICIGTLSPTVIVCMTATICLFEDFQILRSQNMPDCQNVPSGHQS